MKTRYSQSPERGAGNALFFVSNLLSYSQAGRQLLGSQNRRLTGPQWANWSAPSEATVCPRSGAPIAGHTGLPTHNGTSAPRGEGGEPPGYRLISLIPIGYTCVQVLDKEITKAPQHEVFCLSFLQSRIRDENPYGLVFFIHLASMMPTHSDTRKRRRQENRSAGSKSPSTLVRGLIYDAWRETDFGLATVACRWPCRGREGLELT